MGTVHHSNYVKYFEVARWELFRHIDIPYQLVEEAGFMLPVTQMTFKFLKTAHYDQKLTVFTRLKAMKGVRIWFTYRLMNEKDEVICEAETELAFVGRNSWKPCAPPAFVLNCIQEYSGRDKIKMN
jgi:acyl-CoA thioester hydrolase